MKKRICIVLLAALLFSGCEKTMSVLYGVRNIDKFEQERCDDFAASVVRESISLSALVSDSLQFVAYWNLFADTLWKRTAVQPVQILYFMGDTLVSYHVNCYAKGGMASLDWNTDNRFGQFPPQSAVPLTTLQLSFPQIAELYGVEAKKDLKIVVFWTNMLAKISKSAVNAALDNVEKHGQNKKCEVFIINTDKFFINAQEK
ncbi:MAG: hypothetical protein IJQ89_00810 [Bacteroidales bacterium]|nr:hypothetical protein [Bacteroidales bacterium]